MSEVEALQVVIDQIDKMREDILATLSQLVRIPSITPKYPGINREEVIGGETECNKALRHTYEAAGCHIDMWEEEPLRANLIGVLKGTGGGRSLIFNGHIDTVPPGESSAWKWGDPFSGRIEDGKLYGLGSCDMKAGVVAQAKAAEALSKAGIKLKGDLILESVVGEETMDHNAGTTATIKRGYLADAAVVSEPSGPPCSLAVVPCSPGLFWLKITVKGKPTHVCVRGNFIWPGGEGDRIGVNAIEKAFFIADSLKKLEHNWGMSKLHPLFAPGHFTIGPNVILGTPPGPMVPFIVPHLCYIDYIVMYKPEESPEDVKAEVEAFLESVFDQDPWLRVNRPVVEWPHHWPSYDTPIEHPICKVAAEAHADVVGRPAVFHGFAAVDDATYLQMGGIPTITYGPGSLLVAHSANEHVDVEEVITACKVYAAIALKWCGID
ncbi:MAG TPA: ArgE/DapE family deacylase [Clostridia bacterium]|nr:ArgE/DapE family deacylase [Clostridia bacterium]